MSYLPNPPYPDYTSGNVSIYGPTMQVLIRKFGGIPVTDNTYGWRGVAPRQYGSISELLLETAISRVYAGIHYRFTQLASIEFTKTLGNRIADIDLTPYKH